MRQSGIREEARQRHKIRSAMSPHLDLLFPAREAMVKLTMELMRGGPANKEQTSSMARIVDLAIDIRGGFETSVLSLPANMRVSSLVADVRKSIDQLQRQSMELAMRIKHRAS